MAYLACNDYPVAWGMLDLPLIGRGTLQAYLQAPARETPIMAETDVTVAFQDGTTHQMHCVQSGPEGAFWRVVLVSGSGGLSKVIDARYYEDAEAETVVRDLLKDCGERPSGDLKLPGTLPRWVRPEGPAHEALRGLMMLYPGHSWRVLPDGTVWVGEEDWPKHGNEVTILDERPDRQQLTCAQDMTLLPGRLATVTKGKASAEVRAYRVKHIVNDEDHGGLRLELSYTANDPATVGMQQLVEQAVRHLDFSAPYPCKVLKDHGDMMLDLEPENPRLPLLTRIPLVEQGAGVRVRMRPGAAVLLAFQGGSPARPVATVVAVSEVERWELTTAKGQRVLVDDDTGHIRVTANTRVTVEAPTVLVEATGNATVKAGGSARVEAGGAATVQAGSTASITAGASATITAPTVNVNGGTVALAGGGPPVARVGDQVAGVDAMGTPFTGTIVSGSPRVGSG